MSRAFVKEETNYITAHGAARLQEGLAKLRSADDKAADRIAELDSVLASVTIVQPPEQPTKSIAFGARVTVSDAADRKRSYHIVGVDELELYPDALSWISSIGKTLLAAEPGERVSLTQGETFKIVGVEYPT